MHSRSVQLDNRDCISFLVWGTPFLSCFLSAIVGLSLCAIFQMSQIYHHVLSVWPSQKACMCNMIQLCSIDNLAVLQLYHHCIIRSLAVACADAIWCICEIAVFQRELSIILHPHTHIYIYTYTYTYTHTYTRI